MNPPTRRQFSTAIAGLAGLGLAAAGTPAGAQASPPAAASLPDYGAAPEFAGLGQWFNSEPLTMAGLAGKVVLVDFWTYSCVNCVNTIPHVVRWHQQFHPQGLVIVGVHTPEFAFEKVASNVKTAIERFGIAFPVVQDNQFATWKAYDNRYWPAFYLVDKRGRVRRKHFGEGEYVQMEPAIKALLAA